jgi:hypothetical protein
MLRARDPQQEVHVALVGRVAVEHVRAEERAAHLAEERAHAEHAEAEAPVLARKVRHEEPLGARLVAEGVEAHFFSAEGLVEEGLLVRQDALVDERAHAGAEGRELGRKVEVHRVSVR